MMIEQLQECCEIVCTAIGREALPVDEIALIESWQGLPGFSPARLKQLVNERQHGRRVTSARYFDAAVRESFREWSPAPCRLRLLVELPWPEYLARRVQVYGDLSASEVSALHDRWRWEREALGLVLEAPLEVTADDPKLPRRAAVGRPFPAAPGGA